MKGLASYSIVIDDITKDKLIKKVGSNGDMQIINVKRYIQDTIKLYKQTQHAKLILGERLYFIKETGMWKNYYNSMSDLIKILGKNEINKIMKTYFVMIKVMGYPEEIYNKIGYTKCERISRLYPKFTKEIPNLMKDVINKNLSYRQIREIVTQTRKDRLSHGIRPLCSYCQKPLEEILSKKSYKKIMDIIYKDTDNGGHYNYKDK